MTNEWEAYEKAVEEHEIAQECAAAAAELRRRAGVRREAARSAVLRAPRTKDPTRETPWRALYRPGDDPGGWAAYAGSHVDDVALDLVDARHAGLDIRVEVNGVTMFAGKGEDAEAVVKRWRAS